MEDKSDRSNESVLLDTYFIPLTIPPSFLSSLENKENKTKNKFTFCKWAHFCMSSKLLEVLTDSSLDITCRQIFFQHLSSFYQKNKQIKEIKLNTIPINIIHCFLPQFHCKEHPIILYQQNWHPKPLEAEIE